jgi:hypothetical protein
MEANADQNHIQLTSSAFEKIMHPGLISLFAEKKYSHIKGLSEGGEVTGYQISGNAPDIDNLYTHIAMQTMTRVHHAEEKRKLLEEEIELHQRRSAEV